MEMMREYKLNQRTETHRVGRKRNSAFSLIEIMVVLVVLLIGILAIVRLFPAGFLSISRTAEQTAANALTQQVLDLQKNSCLARGDSWGDAGNY